MKIENAKKPPAVFYGLHFSPGVAEYSPEGKEPFRVFINENAAKKMDETFTGKPVYVEHVDEVDLANIQHEADGYVFNSFYNPHDGKHWVRFIVVSDAGQDAIRKGWKLSNAYAPKGPLAPGGLWHGVEYKNEIMDGEYEHLAIVPNPRYEESVIFTPEQFKAYNDSKELELKRLANSKEENPKMAFNFFKKSKVENSKELDLENMMVELPKSKKEMTLSQVINEADKFLNMAGYACDDHMVKANEKEEMSVKDMVKKYGDMQNKLAEMEAKNAGGEGEEAELESMDNEEEAELGEEGDKKMHANAEEEKAKKDENFKKLANAHRVENQVEQVQIMLPQDRVALGKQKYGSN